MKVKFAAGLALTLCTAVLTLGADGSWTGYISDSACGAKGANDKHAACAEKCVKDKGAKYVVRQRRRTTRSTQLTHRTRLRPMPGTTLP